MYSKAAISWASAKQPCVALSSCEAEIITLSEAAKEALHLRGLYEELGVADGKPVKLSTDNTAARDLAYNPEYHKRVKHIAMIATSSCASAYGMATWAHRATYG